MVIDHPDVFGKESPEVFLFVNFTFFRFHSDKFGSLIHHQVSGLPHNFLENIFKVDKILKLSLLVYNITLFI